MDNKDKVELITKQFRQKIEERYVILEMKLFGSSARGDFSKFSDIDIMVKLVAVNRDIEEELYDIAYDLELEYDCVIDVIVLSGSFKNNIPLYQNIKNEGIVI